MMPAIAQQLRRKRAPRRRPPQMASTGKPLCCGGSVAAAFEYLCFLRLEQACGKPLHFVAQLAAAR